ncbi:MAG: hypothetical protein ACRCZI_12145, partial [Cetobacterium sp.]
MKRGSAEVDSNPAPVLPLVEDPGRVLQSIVKNINWAAKGHPSHWVGHDLGACEDFTWRSLAFGGEGFIVTITACDCGIGPKVGIDGFLPPVLTVNDSSSSKFLKLSDSSLCNPRLKVCIHSGVRVGLASFITSILPWLGGEDAIVGMVMEDLDTIKSTVPFKGCLAPEGLLCCLGLLQMHKSIARIVIHKDCSIAITFLGQPSTHLSNQSRSWRVHHVHRDHLTWEGRLEELGL